MKIVKHRKNHMTFSQLKPGDVFMSVNNSDDIFMKIESTAPRCINLRTTEIKICSDAATIIYCPNATLHLD